MMTRERGVGGEERVENMRAELDDLIRQAGDLDVRIWEVQERLRKMNAYILDHPGPRGYEQVVPQP